VFSGVIFRAFILTLPAYTKNWLNRRTHDILSGGLQGVHILMNWNVIEFSNILSSAEAKIVPSYQIVIRLLSLFQPQLASVEIFI
jgi:hypothetical protein